MNILRLTKSPRESIESHRDTCIGALQMVKVVVNPSENLIWAVPRSSNASLSFSCKVSLFGFGCGHWLGMAREASMEVSERRQFQSAEVIEIALSQSELDSSIPRDYNR
nr:hypothetical protein Itr_chr05CG16150 [Ipomoea trifida]